LANPEGVTPRMNAIRVNGRGRISASLSDNGNAIVLVYAKRPLIREESWGDESSLKLAIDGGVHVCCAEEAERSLFIVKTQSFEGMVQIRVNRLDRPSFWLEVTLGADMVPNLVLLDDVDEMHVFGTF
jgi:hypothetical protein